MQAAGATHNFRIVLIPIDPEEPAVSTMTDPELSLAKLPALDQACAEPASSKRLEVAAVIEIAFAFAGILVLLAIGAAIWHSMNFDWFESIRQFQEMI